MDFYVDIAVAVLLRLIKDRKNAVKYFAALAKIQRKLEDLAVIDPGYARTVKQTAGGTS